MSSKFGPFKASRICLLIPILLCLYSLTYADYHYASHSGSNEYPYTSWETAADSITAAMRAADPYDTVYIGTGEYLESTAMSGEDSCLTFIGAGMDSTHIWTDALSAVWYVANRTIAQDIWFSQTQPRFCIAQRTFGMTVIARSCKFVGDIGIFGGGDSVVAENCQFINEIGAIDASFGVRKLVFRNNYFRTTLTPTVFSVSFSTAILENSIFIFDHPNPLGSIWEGALSDTFIVNNCYINNFTEGIYFDGNSLAISTNNTIHKLAIDRDYFGLFLGDDRDSSGAIFINNSISETGTGIWAVHFDNYIHHLSAQYNSFWKNRFGDITLTRWGWENVDTIGNFNAYPMFANPDSYDVHLQAYSPLIDAGDPNILDVDSSRSDIGVFGGPGGSSYEYQDLPPQKPDSLAYQLRPDTIIIRWRLNHEADFNRYIVWRDTIPGFSPWAGNIIAEPDTNVISDTNWDNSHDFYYRIAAYDNQWNMSEISDELVVLISGTDSDNSGVEIPNITSIESNYPNPFNSSTTIAYSVANLGPIPAQINIDIYDIQGRKIRSLLNNRMEVGKHTITWDGRDDSGNELASGIYFARITQWHIDYLSRSQKLILVR